MALPAILHFHILVILLFDATMRGSTCRAAANPFGLKDFKVNDNIFPAAVEKLIRFIRVNQRNRTQPMENILAKHIFRPRRIHCLYVILQFSPSKNREKSAKAFGISSGKIHNVRVKRNRVFQIFNLQFIIGFIQRSKQRFLERGKKAAQYSRNPASSCSGMPPNMVDHISQLSASSEEST